MYNVLIVEDERLVQELFTRYINTVPGKYCLVEAIINAANAEVICKNRKVDLILMDICTSGGSSGLNATKRIKELYPNTKVIIVTSAPEYRFIEKAKAADADSFWYKDISESELLEVMDRTMAGEHIYPDKTPEVAIGYAMSSEFTKKELEVLLHLSTGMSTKEIAGEMGVATETVKEHLKHLMEKTGCTTRTQLAVYASRTKLVLPEY